jgi:tripartite-type tricarboxylate transporter receptor subunit TctC
LVTGPLLADPVPFDVVKDFTPIARVVDYPIFIMTGSGIKAKDLQQLVNETKQKKRSLAQAVPGVGSIAHLACAAFSSAASIEMLAIPYKSTGMAKQALMGNEVDVGCMSAEGVGQFVADGRIRLIAALSPSRSVDYPEVPTAAESGYPGLTARVWLGLFAPKGTPDDVIRKLHSGLQSALRAPELIGLARTQSMDIIHEQPAEAAAAIRSDQEMWANIIKDKRTAFKE